MWSDNVYNKIIKKIRVDGDWINQNLVEHGIQKNHNKVKIRMYSIKFSGNQQDYAGLIKALVGKLPSFVLSNKEIRKYKKEKEDYQPFIEAMKFFGDVDPEQDGKYGEFILFLMVEAILKCPMIAHKIILYNPKDQVKGSDGLFVGKYDSFQALLIGEAKIESSTKKPITNAFKSVSKFYVNGQANLGLSHELIVAKKDISEDFSGEELDYLYDLLNPQSKEYKKTIKVHPILIVYNDKRIKDIEKEAKDNTEAESKLKESIPLIVKELEQDINSEITKNNGTLKKVYLDFFFIPTSDVAKLRHDFYKEIHGVPYKRVV